jgi:hypothetical protein
MVSTSVGMKIRTRTTIFNSYYHYHYPFAMRSAPTVVCLKCNVVVGEAEQNLSLSTSKPIYYLL